MYQYAYLIGDLLLAFPVWLWLFLRRKDLRREILLLSVIVGFLGPISELLYLRDYWEPELFNGWAIGIEDYLFGFFVGGISGSLYEELFGKRYAKRQNRKHHWSLFILPALLVAVTIMGVLVFSFNINSIYATSLAFLAVAIIIIFYRRDLWIDSLASGLLAGLFMFVFYQFFLSLFPEAIIKWWKLGNLSGLFLTDVPIEEFLWAFAWGMMAGPMYEFFAGKRLAKS